MEQWWRDYPWRLIQTNLRQTDMRDIRADRFVRDLKELDADIVMINTGGILAGYDTQVADHPRSEYLQGDSLRQIMLACREAGIRVIARMDFSKIRREVYGRHPDWAYRDANGGIVDYNGDVHACICGGFQQEKAFEILREVCGTLPVDGLYINMGGFVTRDYSYRYYGPCHCDNCKRRFRERFGLELPEREDMADPVYRKYRIFRQEVLADYRQRLTRTVRGIDPGIAVDGVDFFRMESNTEYLRPLPFWQYSAASNTRALRGTEGTAAVSNASVDFIGFYYRHVSVNPEEQELRLWQALANFGGLDYYLIGRLDSHEDRTALPAVKRVFSYARQHAEEYRGIRSMAKVLLLREELWGCRPEERGWVRALTEAHILFDEALIPSIEPETDLGGYRTVILPGVSRLPRQTAEMLDRFAREGGCVIASGETGEYDENFDPYAACPLQCLGIERREEIRRDMLSAMLRVEEGDLAAFPSLRESRLVYFGETFFRESCRPGARGYLRLIPPHPYGPPERCYYTEVTDVPGAWEYPYGKGRGIRIPWNCAGRYYTDGYANTFRFMRDLLVHMAGAYTAEDGPFTPMVAVTAGMARDGRCALIQLVNHTGHFGTSYFEPVPVGDIRLRISLPRRPALVLSGTKNTQVPFDWQQGTLRVKADLQGFFESLLVRF